MAAAPNKERKKVEALRAPQKRSAARIPRVKRSDNGIQGAVMALNNNMVKTTIEGKLGMSEVKVTYPPEILATMRGMFRAQRSYLFQIHASQTMSTIGGGVFNFTFSWNPGSTSFAEWTALAALFDEVLLVKTRLDITSAFGPTSTAIIFQIAIAPDDTTLTGGTPAYTAVQRLAECEYFHCYNMGRTGKSGGPGLFVKSHRVTDRPYATTSAPTGATGTPAGCLGHWAYASNIVGTASINYCFAAMTNVVRLRCRA